MEEAEAYGLASTVYTDGLTQGRWAALPRVVSSKSQRHIHIYVQEEKVVEWLVLPF